MKKKTYIRPVSSIIDIPPMVLLSGSTTSVPYDSDKNTSESLSREYDY